MRRIPWSEARERLFAACPGFADVCRERAPLLGDVEPGAFDDAAPLAEWILERLRGRDTAALSAVFAELERNLENGDAEARRLARICLRVVGTLADGTRFGREAFVPWLRPLSELVWHDPLARLPVDEADRRRRRPQEGTGRAALILRRWDPLGLFEDPGDGLPDDYDRYAPAIEALVERGGTVEELRQHLERIRVEELGVRPEPERDRLFAEEIHAELSGT